MIKEFKDIDGNVYFLKNNSKFRFRPAVYVIVQNETYEFLFIENSILGNWEFSGGGLKSGESFIECGIRELKEETGYDIEIQDDMPFHIENFYHFSRSNQEFEQGIHLFYFGKLKSSIRGNSNFDEGEKILNVKWYALNELRNLNIVYWQKNAFKKLIEKL